MFETYVIICGDKFNNNAIAANFTPIYNPNWIV